MTLQSSGLIRLSDIQTEFGGTEPISLSEYYRNGAYVTSNNTQVPTAGQIGFSQFYSGVKQFIFTISANTQQADLATLATAAGWNGTDPLAATVSAGVYLWSDDITIGGLTVSGVPSGSVITNYGYIMGRGGNGGYRGGPLAQNGGPALANSVSGLIVFNMAGGYIAGGGGGGAGAADYGGDDQGHGGGGAGGGNGGGQLGDRLGGVGGAIGEAGTNGQGGYSTGGGQGGGAGGGGGGSTSINGGGGGGGGRILGAGAYGGAGATISVDGGNGGANGDIGLNGEQLGGTGNGGGGGGGWGAKGGDAYGRTGGAGGAAISGTSVSLTNNGTIYGAVA